MIRYVIVPENEVTPAMVNVSKNTCSENCRKSLLNDYVFKFDSTSELARSIFVNYVWMDLKTIKEIMEQDIWQIL